VESVCFKELKDYLMDEIKKGLEDFEPELPELTMQQNAFVKLISQGYIPTDAYIEAYNCTGKRATAYVEASKLLKHPKITPWIDYYKQVMKDHIANEIKYSIDDAFTEFEEMKLIALQSTDQWGRPNVQAANKAIEMKCKLKALMSDDTINNNSITMQMGDVEVDGIPLRFNIGDDTDAECKTETTEDT